MKQSVSPDVPLPQPPTPIQPQSHSNKNKLIFLIGIILLLISISSVLYYLGQNFAQTPVLPSPIPLVSLTPNSNEVISWKTYKNEQFGFRFKYPNDWVGPFEHEFSTQAAPSFYEIEFGGELRITAKDERYSSPSTLEEMLLKNTKTQDISSNNYRAYKVDYDTGRTAVSISESLRSTKIIYLEYFPTSETKVKIYAQILSTFEFVDSSSTSKIVNLNTVPELYQGIEWDKPKGVEGYEGEDISIYLNGDYHQQLSLKGTKWTKSLTDLSLEQRNQIYTWFESYFVDWLDQNGWNWRTKINDHVEIYASNADGPSGGVYGQIGYDGKNIRLASWMTNTRYKSGEMPRTHTCPCDMEVYYFLSDIIPVENIISQLDEK
ncbi:MAG: hypothetical protein UV59_C0012G0065 [Candidatus Gottesmanbacteria bacterium GW2011_GWA1_43_11]|uniref:Uncharacterized protein n=1 Tax=Candidatus Gottesmanbacteria bacterium GW2011_GWA1_43_11 TaxID=1618436 RepID=A0A0G1CHH9_9BACT|nr:MAG: hypothetical protein UV59_C0012G0065 [Candidatus Gottesmanbacteria bacterium GW2011_GWA1_43_11]